jgi:hypothetical protein
VLTDDNRIAVSVIIAVWPDLNGLFQFLESLSSGQGDSTEILVVGRESPPSEILNRFPWIRWLQGSPEMLIPHLWSIGITQSRGKIVALSTSRFVPDADWIKRICGAHARLASAGIGGAIKPPVKENMTAWAIYFLRYSAYLNYTREQTVDEIAGENASYKRDSLSAHWAAFADGFWEPEFHRLLKTDGETLWFVPGISITQGTPLRVSCFCRQRFQHGRHFGRERIRESPAMMRLVRILTSPLIPFVLLAKIFGRVIASRRYFWQLLLSLPILVVFIGAWTMGEIVGYCIAGSNESRYGDGNKVRNEFTSF